MRLRPDQVDRAETEPAEQRHLEEIETEDKNRPRARDGAESGDKQRRHRGPAQGRDEEGER